MARPSGRRLKVFAARLGFFDTIVAVPSRAAALRAWDVHQNLFADGLAHPTEDAAAVAAALAHPETPLKRAAGSSDAFAIAPSGLPQVPDIAGSARASRTPKRRTKPSVPPEPPADRSRLDAAEAALSALDQDRTGEEAAFHRRQDALDAERAAAREAYAARRKAASRALTEARAAYKAAGGGA